MTEAPKRRTARQQDAGVELSAIEAAERIVAAEQDVDDASTPAQAIVRPETLLETAPENLPETVPQTVPQTLPESEAIEPYRCLDCGAEALGRYCSQCGQETREQRAPMFELFRDVLDHLSVDSKLPRSLYALVLKPGLLTNHYLAGRRTSYVKPLRMYLVLSVVFFLLFSLQPIDVSDVNVYVGDQLIGEAKDGSTNSIRIFSTGTEYEDPSRFGQWLNARFAGQEERFKQMEAQALIDRLFMGLQNNLPRALFVFLPLLALALKVVFLRSGVLYFDHFIFALHFQTFLFLLLSVCWVFGSGKVYLGAGLLVAPIYLLLAMRRIYPGRQRWIVLRWLLLIVAWLVVVVSYLILLAIVFLGVLFYVLATV
ncbi:MAG: DUF3667 domain-containing protein [Acidobacteriota bacterium]